MFMRLLPTRGGFVSAGDAERISKMYGTDQWRHIYESRLANEISPEQARNEYLNLMRRRLETNWVTNGPIPSKFEMKGGAVIYHMIFATDHEAGDRIMLHLYHKAAEEFAKMREEARRLRQIKEEERGGIQRLFSHEESRSAPREGENFYEHEPPTRPWFLRED